MGVAGSGVAERHGVSSGAVAARAVAEPEEGFSPLDLGAKLLADYDLTQIRPAYGAGPHSRALVPMALELSGVDTTGPYMQESSLTGHSAGEDLLIRGWIRTGNDNDGALSITGGGVGVNLVLLYNLASNFTIGIRKGGNGFDSWSVGSALPVGELCGVEIYIQGDGETATAKVWHDGTLLVDASDTHTGTTSDSFSAGMDNLELGRAASNPTPRWGGSWAELGLWRAAPTAGGTAAFARGDFGGDIEKGDLIDFFSLDSERRGAGIKGHILAESGSPSFAGDKVALVRDLSGNNRHRIYWGQGTTWEGSGDARYLNYPGSASGVAIVSVPESLIEIHATIANTGSAGTEYAITVRDADGSVQFGVGTLTGNRRFGRVEDGGGGDTLVGPGPVTDGGWTTLSLRPKAADSHELSQDGASSDTSTVDLDEAGTDTVIFGGRTGSGATPFGGQEGRSQITLQLTEAESKRLTRYNARPHGIAVA